MFYSRPGALRSIVGAGRSAFSRPRPDFWPDQRQQMRQPLRHSARHSR